MPAEEPTTSKHLLIVDDEPVILQILKAVFEDEPYRLSCVGTGHDAKRIIEEQGCDLLITDKNLPDINGLELLQLTKEVNPFAEVIIITGYASLETAITALEYQAFDYVVKPLNNVFDIRKKVRRAIERQNMALENQKLLDDLQDRNRSLENALTEQQCLQSELIQSEKLAGIGTLAAGVAHEISSPLFGIMGLAEAIPDEADRETAAQYARDIVEYCQNIGEIVKELSSYSRAASVDGIAQVDVADTVADAIKLIERTASVDGVEFENQCDAELVVRAKPNEIQQIFVNLLKNAAEAVQDEHGPDNGGKVTVTAGRGLDHVWIRVEDNGVGIPEERLGMVFDPFYTTKPPGKGTGLGLNVVYRIVTKYRGTIQVQSHPGTGTSFALQFPVQG
jgi:signal transduction histidine kinase